jgi:hypothetical protein
MKHIQTTTQPHECPALLEYAPRPDCGFCGYPLPEHHPFCPIAQASPVTPRTPSLWYDYDVQAWVRDGKYLTCAHPGTNCGCYARAHAGEPADPRHYQERS